MSLSYIERPQNCRFEGQDPDEKILLLLRSHPITNIPWILLSVFVFLIPFFLPEVAAFIKLDIGILPQNFLIILVILDYLLVLTILFEGFLNWYFNVTLVTNEKVVGIDFSNLLYKGVDLAPLPKIEEADSTTAGILGTIFNFGNVSIQTAGAKVAIEMKNVSRSSVVADMVLDLAGKPHEHILGVPKLDGSE